MRTPRISITLALLGCLAVVGGGWARAARAVPWDVAPIDPGAAVLPLACPQGDGRNGPDDALVALRFVVGQVTGFSCNGNPVPGKSVDVEPCGPAAGLDCIVMGNGSNTLADALLLLQNSVQLVHLVEGLDFRVQGGVISDPLTPLASDADRPPLGNFPGPEDMDEGNGILDLRTLILAATVASSVATDVVANPVSVCAYNQDPDANPAAAPLACSNLGPVTPTRFIASVKVDAPAAVGPADFWLRVDAEDEVDEPDETNNVAMATVQVVAPPPPIADLTFQAAPGQGQALGFLFPPPIAGGMGTLRLSLANVGTADIDDTFAIDFFLDPGFPPEVGDCSSIFTQISGGVAAGQNQVVEFSTNFQNSLPGSHVLYAVLDSGLQTCDSDGDIEEATESNNVDSVEFCLGTKPASQGDRVDLRADALELFVGGGGYSVQARFSNAGTADMTPFLPAPADARITVSQAGINPIQFEISFDCLPIGETAFFLPDQIFSLGSTPAQVRLQLDPFSELQETNENNNSLCIQVDGSGNTTPC